MTASWRNRSGAGPGGGPIDTRIVSWLTAPEGATAKPVLDRAFAELQGVRQDRVRPWSALLESMSRPVAVRLPQWVWIALVLLLVLALSLATLVGVDRLRPLFDRQSVLPAAPAQVSVVACSSEVAETPDTRCLTATLPVRHERSAGTLSLPITEFKPSSGSPSGSPPILVFDTLDPRGEQTRVDFARYAQATGHTVIAVALRGSLRADALLRCPELEDVSRSFPGTPLADDRLRTALAEAVRTCHQRLSGSGVDLEAFRPIQAAADLESIRAALGVPTWIVRARGRDAEVALGMARGYPTSVAGVLLVNPITSTDRGEDPKAAFDASLNELSRLCSADAFCSTQYRSPREALASIEALLAVGPQTVRVSSLRGGDVAVPVDIGLVRAAIRDGVAGYTSIGSIPSQLDRMNGGDLRWPARRLVDRGWCLGSELSCTEEGWSGGGEFAMACDVRQTASSGGVDLDPLAVVCDSWVEGGREELAGAPTSSDVPIIAFVGKVDPSSNAARAQGDLERFTHGTVVELPWTPEGIEFSCLRAADPRWFDAPHEIGVLPCPAAGVPQFADAP
jgi:pimeloyl-ACP methyl ester carboxylesterase